MRGGLRGRRSTAGRLAGLLRPLSLGLCGNSAEESQCGSIACRPRRSFGEEHGVRNWDRKAVLFGERGDFVRLIVRRMADVEFEIHVSSSSQFATLPLLGLMQKLNYRRIARVQQLEIE